MKINKDSPDILKKLTSAYPVKKGGRCIDIGCGSGKSVSFLRKSGLDAVGIDADPKSIKGRFCIVADALSLPFKSGIFDAAVSECSLSVIGHPGKVLKECGRVLRPGSFFYLTDVCAEGEAVKCGDIEILTCQVIREYIVNSGFEILEFNDERAAWKTFIAECIWRDKELCSFCTEKPKNISYYSAVLRKESCGYGRTDGEN